MEKDNPCHGCGAICCRDMSMRILKPDTEHEISELRWQLHYDTVKVYIKSNRWHLLVHGNCIYLDEKGHCTIYDRRPQKCRDHKADNCERNSGEPYWDILISTPEELDEFWLKRYKKKIN